MFLYCFLWGWRCYGEEAVLFYSKTNKKFSYQGELIYDLMLDEGLQNETNKRVNTSGGGGGGLPLC